MVFLTLHAHAIDHIKASFLPTLMTDFFSNLGSGIRFPDARIGGSNPLPTSLSGPAGINGDPDGRYNFNGNLLDGVSPYAGPDGGRMGSDRNYQQVPHRVQHIVPKLYLPKAQFLEGKQTLELSHAVDQGDIAFVIVSERIQHLVTPNAQFNGPRLQLPARNAFVNLPTVNYLLAGLQRLDETHNKRGKDRSAWAQLADDLQYDFSNPNRLAELLRLVSTRLLPYGICAGSEHQGGKHETGIAPVQAAANHVTTMTVDGQNRDLVNYWRASNISAGDTLIFRLERVPTKQFTLNHYYKQMAFEDFGRAEVCYQLVPDVFRMSYNPKLNLEQKMPQPTLTHANTKTQNSVKDNIQYDYRLHGYWRIGQMFHHRNQHDMECNNYSDDKVFLRGQLMQVTFAPMWIQLDDRLPLDGKLKPHQHYASTLPQSTKKRKTEGGGDGGGGKRNSMISGHAYGGAIVSAPVPPFPAGDVVPWLQRTTPYTANPADTTFSNVHNARFIADCALLEAHITATPTLTAQQVQDWILEPTNGLNNDDHWPISQVWQELAPMIGALSPYSGSWNRLPAPYIDDNRMYIHRIVHKMYTDLKAYYNARREWDPDLKNIFDGCEDGGSTYDGLKQRCWSMTVDRTTGIQPLIDNFDVIRQRYNPGPGPALTAWIGADFSLLLTRISTVYLNDITTTYRDTPDTWTTTMGGGPLIFRAVFEPMHGNDILTTSAHASGANSVSMESNLPVNSAQVSSQDLPQVSAPLPLSQSPAASTNTQNISKPKIVVRKAGDVLSSLMAEDGEGGKNEGGGKSAKKKVFFGKRGEKD